MELAGRTAVELAIQKAVIAGGLWTASSMYFDAQNGLERAASYHSAQGKIFVNQIASDAWIEPQAPAAMPTREA